MTVVGAGDRVNVRYGTAGRPARRWGRQDAGPAYKGSMPETKILIFPYLRAAGGKDTPVNSCLI